MSSRRDIRRFPVQSNKLIDRLSEKHLVVGFIGVMLLINAAILFWPIDDSDQRYYDTYLETWTRLIEIHQSGRATEEFDQFAEETRPRIQSIVDTLESSAGPAEPTKQHLLWAGRDFLLPVLRGKAGAGEDSFQRHMKMAYRHLRDAGFDVAPPPSDEEPSGENQPAAGSA